MVSYKHNEAYYELKFSELEEENINVLSFEGEEEISHLFEYRIEFISKNPELDSSKILNKKAAFILNRGDEDPITIHGIVSHFEQFGNTADYIFYKITLVPQIWRSTLIFRNEVYQEVNIKDIIEIILKDSDLSDYMIDLKSSYSQKEYLVQYKETNLNFLNRRLEHYGIYYYFDHSGDKDAIVFIDSNAKLDNLPLKSAVGFNINKDPLSEKESIYEINCCEKIVTGMVQLKDYNYLFPEKQLMAQSQINDSDEGKFYDFGDGFEDETEAELLAKVRNQELLCRSKIFTGKSDCRYFSAGFKFKLEKHYRQSWNTEYIITKVTHRGNQYGLFGLLPASKKVSPTYENYFTAIPSDIEYRPSRRTPIPKINGIMSAKIETAEGEDIYIDEHGRYKAKMLFDISDKKNGEASSWIRLSQNYSGAGYGIHFPNHENTELLWACVDGNVDRPIGLGTVPNPSNASPSISGNKTQSVIRTAANNEIVIEDKGGDEQIHINQACGNEIHMKAAGPDIEIKQKCGNQILMKEAEGIHIKDKYGNEVKLDSAAGTLTLHSPTHETKMVLGKSFNMETLSNWGATIQGNWKGIVMGEKAEMVSGPSKIKWDGIAQTTHGGLSQDNFLGVKSSNFVGATIAANYSTSFTKTKGAKRTYCDATDKLKSADKEEKVEGKYTLEVGGNFDVDVQSHIYFKVGGTEFLIDGDSVMMSASSILIKSKGDIVLNAGGKVTMPKGKLDDKSITTS